MDVKFVVVASIQSLISITLSQWIAKVQCILSASDSLMILKYPRKKGILILKLLNKGCKGPYLT